jgi:hypothetical protein
LVAAPAIVRYASLMPVKAMPVVRALDRWLQDYPPDTLTVVLSPSQMADLIAFAPARPKNVVGYEADVVEVHGMRFIESMPLQWPGKANQSF